MNGALCGVSYEDLLYSKMTNSRLRHQSLVYIGKMIHQDVAFWTTRYEEHGSENKILSIMTFDVEDDDEMGRRYVVLEEHCLEGYR